MGKLIDLTGVRFGYLTVTMRSGTSKTGKVLWICICDCGRETVVFGSNLKMGKQTSCGCKRLEIHTKHNNAREGQHTTEYNSWLAMISRCENPNATGYESYGRRGIKVCSRWRGSFENFLRDMGRKPTRLHTIDRIDVNGDYYPNNCRWATKSEQTINRRTQSNNKSGVPGVYFDEEVKKWASRIKVNYKDIYLGYYHNKEEAITARKKAELLYWGKASI